MLTITMRAKLRMQYVRQFLILTSVLLLHSVASNFSESDTAFRSRKKLDVSAANIWKYPCHSLSVLTGKIWKKCIYYLSYILITQCKHIFLRVFGYFSRQVLTKWKLTKFRKLVLLPITAQIFSFYKYLFLLGVNYL